MCEPRQKYNVFKIHVMISNRSLVEFSNLKLRLMKTNQCEVFYIQLCPTGKVMHYVSAVMRVSGDQSLENCIYVKISTSEWLHLNI